MATTTWKAVAFDGCWFLVGRRLHLAEHSKLDAVMSLLHERITLTQPWVSSKHILATLRAMCGQHPG